MSESEKNVAPQGFCTGDRGRTAKHGPLASFGVHSNFRNKEPRSETLATRRNRGREESCHDGVSATYDVESQLRHAVPPRLLPASDEAVPKSNDAIVMLKRTPRLIWSSAVWGT